MASDDILCEAAEGVLTITLNRPDKLNAFTPDMRDAMIAAFDRADEDDAIRWANATEFGLGANAWTNDEDERTVLVRDLAAGAVFINGMVTSYPELPFGGIKTSGYGRELSAQGIRAFCNLKTVWVGRD